MRYVKPNDIPLVAIRRQQDTYNSQLRCDYIDVQSVLNVLFSVSVFSFSGPCGVAPGFVAHVVRFDSPSSVDETCVELLALGTYEGSDSRGACLGWFRGTGTPDVQKQAIGSLLVFAEPG